MVVFETLVRNMTDAMYATSERFRKLISDNPQRFYYPFMLALLVVMGVIIFQALPTELIAWAANMANFAALFFPLVLIYVNARLPRPAKPWWTTVVLILNAVLRILLLEFRLQLFLQSAAGQFLTASGRGMNTLSPSEEEQSLDWKTFVYFNDVRWMHRRRNFMIAWPFQKAP
jgi:hypothetical protein